MQLPADLFTVPVQAQGQEDEGCEQVIPVSQELGQRVHLALEEYFPRTTPLSMLLLHISQWEYKQVAPQSALIHQRHRFHAPDSFLEQVLTNMRRAIRGRDQILTYPGAGAVLFFPNVDERGIYSILDRVYRNVTLLQAETVIPPLKYETDILIGIGSYPEPGISIEQLLSQTSVPAQRFTLRPAITPQFWGLASTVAPLSLEAEGEQQSGGKQKRMTEQATNEATEITASTSPTSSISSMSSTASNAAATSYTTGAIYATARTIAEASEALDSLPTGARAALRSRRARPSLPDRRTVRSHR